jgi:hypothetical protein
MTVADRFRAAIRRASRSVMFAAANTSAAPALGARPALLALPAPPGAHLGPVCPACKTRHPVDRGLALTYGSPIGDLGDGRPRPLRDQAADRSALDRDRFTPWRYP